MNKKAIFLAMICFILVGCGNKKPDNVSQDMYDTAIYVINVTDLYLDGEATVEETKEKLDSVNVEYNPNNDEYDGDSNIEAHIISLKSSVESVELGYGTSTISDVKEERDELADKINYND